MSIYPFRAQARDEKYIVSRLDSGLSACCSCPQRGIWTIITRHVGPGGTQEMRFQHVCEEHAAEFAAQHDVRFDADNQ